MNYGTLSNLSYAHTSYIFIFSLSQHIKIAACPFDKKIITEIIFHTL